MTREEAIKQLDGADIAVLNRDFFKFNQAIIMAISALRQQENVTKCHDLFDEDGGDIYPEKDSICSSTNLPCCRCNPGPCEHRKETVTERHELTNAQKIRAMTDEELAGFLMKLMGHAQCFAEGMFPYHPCPQNYNCKQCGIEWLQQPAEEDDHETG